MLWYSIEQSITEDKPRGLYKIRGRYCDTFIYYVTRSVQSLKRGRKALARVHRHKYDFRMFQTDIIRKYGESFFYTYRQQQLQGLQTLLDDLVMTEEPDKIYVTRVEFRQNKFEGGYDTNIFVITGLYKHKDLNEEFYQVKVKLRPVSLQTLRYISFMKETDAINKVKETFKIARIILFAKPEGLLDRTNTYTFWEDTVKLLGLENITDLCKYTSFTDMCEKLLKTQKYSTKTIYRRFTGIIEELFDIEVV